MEATKIEMVNDIGDKLPKLPDAMQELVFHVISSKVAGLTDDTSEDQKEGGAEEDAQQQ